MCARIHGIREESDEKLKAERRARREPLRLAFHVQDGRKKTADRRRRIPAALFLGSQPAPRSPLFLAVRVPRRKPLRVLRRQILICSQPAAAALLLPDCTVPVVPDGQSLSQLQTRPS